MIAGAQKQTREKGAGRQKGPPGVPAPAIGQTQGQEEGEGGLRWQQEFYIGRSVKPQQQEKRDRQQKPGQHRTDAGLALPPLPQPGQQDERSGSRDGCRERGREFCRSTHAESAKQLTQGLEQGSGFAGVGPTGYAAIRRRQPGQIEQGRQGI